MWWSLVKRRRIMAGNVCDNESRGTGWGEEDQLWVERATKKNFDIHVWLMIVNTGDRLSGYVRNGGGEKVCRKKRCKRDDEEEKIGSPSLHSIMMIWLHLMSYLSIRRMMMEMMESEMNNRIEGWRSVMTTQLLLLMSTWDPNNINILMWMIRRKKEVEWWSV